MTEVDSVAASLAPDALPALKARANELLNMAGDAGACAAEVSIGVAEGLSVSVRLGEVETLEFHRDRGISLTVYSEDGGGGLRKGSASSSDESPASLARTVAAAMAIADHTGADPASGLAAPQQLASELPDLDLYHPWSLSPQQAMELAQSCEAAGRSDARISNSDGANLSSGNSLRVYANSQGFCAGYAASQHSLSCVLVAGEQDAMQRDYWFDSRRDPAALMAAEAIGAEAQRRTLARLGAEPPATGNYPILFAPRAAASLLGHLTAAISGGALYRNASFLRDRLGEQLFPHWVHIHERPLLPGSAGSAAWDQDGLATRNQAFVEGGTLSRYALGLYAARRLDMAPTGNGGGVRNLTIDSSGEDLPTLLGQMGRGILVTEVMGPGVNIVTGDYSRGAAGFLIENGQIGRPLHEFTIAAPLTEIFARLVAAGTDVDDRGNIHCGSLLVEQMRVAGS